ncbi:PEP-CTERM-box response regulator transcription factor [Massilia varians]|uniref:PEP-CTERM-box response regulator transcription factor n=1 Tax=Massilia varians TaxID=457921 RepID=A0ABM8C130_9BURK|nr:PEP-CTERM-box response regulator transcription factor [Massilia varians]BDT56871.1 PEP-CTERM-box response regulator transcription factor [Massilia varians]
MTQTKPKLLIIEDDPGVQKQLRWSLDGYDVVVAGDREAALAQIRRHEPAVCTMDLGLPPDPDGSTEGLATLQQILALAPDTRVIVLTGNQDHANAVKAIGMGAYDFHQKPCDPEVLNLVIQRAFFLHDLQMENRRLQETQADAPLAGVISRDPGMLKVCRNIEKVAPTSASVMLLGESGTGKEVLARALHQLSPRAKERFMAINCAAIPENLLESELFGYEKGAFTGAAKQTKGKVELAHGGTFFLDEVGDLPMPLQAKLLRFLQQRVIERIGGHEEIPVDVRIVCATHQKLKELCAQGRFREDLYYRLSEIVVTIPPLRTREGDAALLAHHFKNKFCASEGRSSLNFAPDAIAAIEAYNWPGNVREMENYVKRAVIMADGNTIVADDLGLPSEGAVEEPINLRQVRDEAEYKAIVKVLARVDGNIVKASEMLGVSRPTLYDLMSRHGIKASSQNGN